MKWKIGILGCGWLGLPLAENLIARGHTVYGTTTRTTRLQILQNAGIQAHLLEVAATGWIGDMSFFKGVHVLVIAFPPGSRKGQATNFLEKIEYCCKAIREYKIPKTVLISSTSTYGKQPGILNEDTPPKPQTVSATQYVASENLIQQSGENNCIIRLGGLIGADRHPVRSLSGKTTAHPNSPVNLIHQKDAVNLTIEVIENAKLKGIYNGVAPSHPAREAYYRAMAAHLSLPEPKFYPEQGPESIISGEKIEKESGFTYQIKKLIPE